ncbi:MAG TPA: cytochrome P450 [Lacipirellulaceae bacterium]|jgi:cytochrome P450
MPCAPFPPGPKDRLFGMRTLRAIRRNSVEFYDAMRRQYGDVVYMKLGPYHDYTLFHPDHIHELLAEKAKSFVRMRRLMTVFRQWNGNSVLIAEGQDWLRQRRLLQPAFQPKRFEAYTGEVNRATEHAIQEIAEAGTAEVNFERSMNNLTTDIICRTMFGANLGDELDEARSAVQIVSDAAIKEILQFFSLPLWVPLPSIRRKCWAIDKLRSIVGRFIKERRAAGTDAGDLLSMMLLATDEQGGARSLSDEEVRDNCVTIFVAGHDTTAAGLTWLGWFLASRPEIAARVRAEIDSVVGDRPPTYADLENLPILDQTVKETLRHRPPAIGIFSREVSEPVEIGGYLLPKGALVHAMSYNVHHDERWFDSPESFDPDRFSPERIDRIPPNAYFPFGIGPRICIGYNFARMEMVLVAILLMQRFVLTPAPGQIEPQPFPGVSLRPIGGMRLCCRPRHDGR